MPKMKSHKGTTRRMKLTGTGKVMRRKAGSSHLMSVKSSKRRRGYRKDAQVSPGIAKKARIIISRRRK
jgi:large subunit ribosomal protein L35